ncbi:MltR family transcriptional regulator [Pseudomonas aeruginosa]|uniref:MltR family transcriptional regulator n=1 Tax=Pseudomonas aeruginosa TaxID=287 RepID=UPI00276EAFD2|nr:MltR family transcriptional regulator [Pseudomonas aeruginosa]HBO5029616.1 hypothetical protein [Pseudomonas aeruginosa]
MGIKGFKLPDIHNESDRGCVIVAAAVIDSWLEELITSQVKKHSVTNSTLKSLFDMNGPISNFSSKIIICRSFGVIDEVAYHDLMIVRKLRNSFAHSSGGASFLSLEVRQKVRSMIHAQEHMKTTYKEFFNGSPKISSVDLPTEWELQNAGLMPVDKSLFISAIYSIALHVMKCLTGENEFIWKLN